MVGLEWMTEDKKRKRRKTMCDQATQTAVTDAANDFISQNKMFTAYDVTRKVRAMNVNVFHKDVREVVRDMFSTGQMQNYSKRLMPIPSSPNPAFVYHPVTDDPANYDPLCNLPGNQASSKSTATATPAPVTPASTPDADDDDDSDDVSTIKVDRQGDGFIRVPARYMRAVGVKPGDEVSVEPIGSQGITVEKASSKKHLNEDNILQTDARNNLRISCMRLDSALVKRKANIEFQQGGYLIVT
jgi:antitoxin component of MazEF toxin-antitoxin module